MVLQHEWSYKIMNSFYDGYSGDAFILMVRMLYLSFFLSFFASLLPLKKMAVCVRGGKKDFQGRGGICVTIFHAFNILIIQ